MPHSKDVVLEDREEKRLRKHRNHSEESERRPRRHRKEKRRRRSSPSVSDEGGSESEDSGRRHRHRKKKRRRKGLAIDQSMYGKYGLISEADFYNKRQEFECWMRSIKKISAPEMLSKRESREHFANFVEDYNTATFPSKKYYDLDLYEAKKLRKRSGRLKAVERTVFNDEEERRKELLQLKERERREGVQSALKGMDREKARAMKSQSELRLQMQTAFRTGNAKEAERIQKLLKPDRREDE